MGEVKGACGAEGGERARVPATTHPEKPDRSSGRRGAGAGCGCKRRASGQRSDGCGAMGGAVGGRIEAHRNASVPVGRSWPGRRADRRIRGFPGGLEKGAPPAIYVPTGRSGSSSRTPGWLRMRSMASREEISRARKRCTQRRTTKQFRFCKYRPASVRRSGRIESRMGVIVEMRPALSMPESGESGQIGEAEAGGAAAKGLRGSGQDRGTACEIPVSKTSTPEHRRSAARTTAPTRSSSTPGNGGLRGRRYRIATMRSCATRVARSSSACTRFTSRPGTRFPGNGRALDAGRSGPGCAGGGCESDGAIDGRRGAVAGAVRRPARAERRWAACSRTS